MRRPKNQIAAVMDDDFDPTAPKAENVLLASEKPKPTVVVKKSRKLGAKASVSPDVAPTAKKAKAATPTPEKPKEPSWTPPKGSTRITSSQGEKIGWLSLKGQVYEAFTDTGQRLAIGLTESSATENFRKKHSAWSASQSR